jgi:cholesterol transport system auxiliary component
MEAHSRALVSQASRPPLLRQNPLKPSEALTSEALIHATVNNMPSTQQQSGDSMLHHSSPSSDKSIAGLRVAFCLTIALALTACATPSAPVGKTVYDFGPAKATVVAAPGPSAPALMLNDTVSNTALSNSAVQYRLIYANAQELRPYSLARWSMSPTQLVHQRVRSALTAAGPVLTAGDGVAALTLTLELEEFSQQFEAPETSQGVVILRATLLKKGALHAQESFEARAPAPTSDAAGGVHALSAATESVAEKLAVWVKTQAQ